jgi:hypothetical protein
VYVLDTDTLSFWQETYDNAMLEFLYLNNLEDGVVLVQGDSMEDKEDEVDGEDDEGCEVGMIRTAADGCNDAAAKFSFVPSSANKVLVPIGGGKDSLVVWHSCMAAGQDPALVYVADGKEEFDESWRLRRIMAVAGEGRPYSLCRHVFADDMWLRFSRSTLTEEGHPWAMLVLFDSLLTACLLKIPAIQLGFERSADFGNGMHFLGKEVNHQYDKSSMFLERANAYIHSNVTECVTAYSSLADKWELEIAKDFCMLPALRKFHGVFMSCNEPIDDTRWCAKCDKCAFVYLLMSAFLPQEQVWLVFGENLFEKPALLPVFLRLVGESPTEATKAFDCVGEAWEAAAAVELSVRRFASDSAATATATAASNLMAALPSLELPVVLHELCLALGISGWTAAADAQIIETWHRKKRTDAEAK